MTVTPAAPSNAPPGQASAPLASWLDGLGAATAKAQAAEDAFRAEAARRTAVLAEARAFAFRRLNLMRPVAEAVAGAEDGETAVAHGLAVLRSRLGWSQPSEARTAIAERFARVCAAIHASLDQADVAGTSPDSGAADPGRELAAFEQWYLDWRGTAFWTLFETYMPETPVVDF